MVRVKEGNEEGGRKKREGKRRGREKEEKRAGVREITFLCHASAAVLYQWPTKSESNGPRVPTSPHESSLALWSSLHSMNTSFRLGGRSSFVKAD